jgi:amino acid adenylation domain-containing protein
MSVQDGMAEFLAHLRELDISLRLENSRLRVNAPKNVLTPELREELASRKDDIVAFLSDTAIAVHSKSPSIERVPRNGPLSLSFAQSRLWFLDQFTPGSTAYTLPMYTRLRGALDIAVLEKSLSEVTRRHEILRTVFPAVDGSPSQVILAASACAIPLADLSGLPTEERESRALQLAAVEAKKPFDLAKGPLWRAQLLRLGEQDHVLLFSMHHIVFDGSSIDVFWHDLAALYCAMRANEPSPLPELPFQYVDFASWQKRLLDGPVRESHLAYWKQQLGENPPSLNLLLDRPVQDSANPPGGKRALELSPALSASLRSLSQIERASLSMTLLAAFNVLLHRWAGQEDILVGMPVAGRSHSDFEKMVGIFVNTMVVRTRLSGSLSFLDVLHQVRDTMLDALEHQDMPFEELVEALDRRRDPHRTPLFQVFFNTLNMQLTPVEIPGLRVEPFGEFEVESKFDVSLYVYERNDSISLMLVYNTQLFSESRIAAFLEEYERLLAQLCENPLRSIEEYSLATPSSVALLPNPAVPLADQWLGPVHSRFLQLAAETPARVALVDKNAEWTYGELADHSAGVRDWLLSQGVGQGDTVAVYGHRSAPLVLALLGILRSGVAFCILDPAYPDLRLAGCVRIARPKAWLQITAAGPVPENLEAAVAETAGARRLILPETPRAGLSDGLTGAPDLPQQDETDRPAYVTFTSGTTGDPKCISGTHKPLSHFLDWHVRQFGLNSSDRFSMLSGLAHDPLLRDILAPLWVGATLVIPDPGHILTPGRLAEWMEQQGITVAHLTPAMGALLVQPAGHRKEVPMELSRLRYAFFGGDILTSHDVELVSELAPNARCISFYGATETPQAMAWCDARERTTDSTSDFSRQIPIGNPIADVQILILNRAGTLAGIGELGEIHIRTHYLSQGYLNDAAATCERFPTNPFTGEPADRLYRTGDLGRYRPDGMVEFSGRADNQIKLRGYRIELGEIEAALKKHPDVNDCAVVAEQSSNETKRLVAYFVATRETHPDPLHLREHLSKLLPDYQVPSEFHPLLSMPLTPNGKVDRRALASGDYRLPSCRTSVQPRNQVEATMAEIWSNVLGVEHVGVFDNFFELGGHSMAATRLVARLESAFGVDIPLQAFFLEPTIAALAEHVQYDASSRSYQYFNTIPRWKCMVAMQTEGTRTPFFFVAGYQNPDDALVMLSRFVPYLGADQPVYGFRPRWIEGDGEAYTSVEDAARDFLSELRTVQPHGPYLMGGFCVGGVIALEMAHQLIEEGEQVSFLALLDCERPSLPRALFADLRLMSHRVTHMANVISEIIGSRGTARTTMIRELVRRKLGGKQPDQPAASTDNSFYDNKIGYRRLAYKHSVREYPGRITLIVNERQYRFDRYMGWRGVAREGLIVHKVPGDHDSVLRVHGREFADLLLKCMDDARPRSVQPQLKTTEVLS